GLVYAEGAAAFVRLHFWQDGQPDRAATLPYDATQRDRLADRFYRKLVTPHAVGDVELTGGPAGELFVDGTPAGAYVTGAELTLATGEHVLEVRDGPRVLARGRTRIEPGGRSQATLMPVAELAPPPPPPDHGPPPIVVRPRPSAWPWVLGGVGVAGLAGAGTLFALRQSELRDLEQSCYGRACTPDQQRAVDRAGRYGTLSVASLGVGLAAGAGLVTYLIMAKREPRVMGGFAPIAGGAAVSLGGSF
ncbi:MAG TPA: hypothetical protein VFS00_08555, partial [Polyangiaceae bacterium]|nr:hypothetical protein [Polyangiaceae bacterium]